VTWFLLAVVAALCYALQGAWSKRLTETVSRQAATWAIFAFSFPLLLLYLAVDGLPAVETRFWWVLAVNLVLYVVSFRLYVSALEVGELGVTYPLLAVTPVFVVPVEWLLLGDRVGLLGLGGIVLVAAGVYMLHLERRTKSLLAPFRAVAARPGARRMLAVALVWAVSGTLDRAAVLSASPAAYGVAISLAVGAALAPSALRDVGFAFVPGAEDEAGRRGEEGRAEPRSRRAVLGGLGVQGALFAVMFVAQMEALRLSLAANVITVKRSGTLLTVVLGGMLFREKGLAHRLAGTVVVLVGVWLVARS
jgi:drug/metabolite transporter (DMT)-like permease